jgi:hypothetical protein
MYGSRRTRSTSSSTAAMRPRPPRVPDENVAPSAARKPLSWGAKDAQRTKREGRPAQNLPRRKPSLWERKERSAAAPGFNGSPTQCVSCCRPDIDCGRKEEVDVGAVEINLENMFRDAGPFGQSLTRSSYASAGKYLYHNAPRECTWFGRNVPDAVGENPPKNPWERGKNP